jgi:outer membrane autotransporter protein
LASTLDAEAFEFPVITYGAQNLWYASTGVWLDRTVDLRAALAAGGSGGGGADAALPIVEPVAGNVTPAVWGRVFGGTLERDISNISEAPDGLQGPAFTFEDQFNQDYYGVMAGVDFGKETGMNQAWMFGIMGGYTGSNLDFDGTGTEVEYQQGSIGAYITYINGGFFADVAVKGDFGSIDYSTQFGGTADADYVSIGVIGDVGYRHNMSSGWFIEPKATLAYVNTDIDDINVLGTGISFEDGDSVRGRLGARIGTQMQKGSSLIEPYLEANVWNEFEGNYNATLASGGFGIPVMYDAEGVFGEVTAGADIINVGNGWNAFGRASVQFGDDGLFGVSGNAGFRKAF